MAPLDINTKITYHVVDGQTPFFYGFPPEGGAPETGGTKIEKNVTVRDGRDKGFQLDDIGFELVPCPTALSTEDFYNDDAKIRSVYYQEMETLIKNKTGAEKVIIFDHRIRNEDRYLPDPETFAVHVQKYASMAHCDGGPVGGPMYFGVVSSFKVFDSRFFKGRFVWLNVWRNIADEPIQNNHLGVVDQRSLTLGTSSEDYIPMDYFGYQPETGQIMRATAFTLNEKNSEDHEWFYFSKMRKDEAMMFKQWDSDPAKSVQMVFHSAFKDDNAAVEAPPRESIEVLALCYFPDHRPNTCPNPALIRIFRFLYTFTAFRAHVTENLWAYVTAGLGILAVGLAAWKAPYSVLVTKAV